MSSALLIILVVLICLLLIGAPVMYAVGTAGLVYFFVAPHMLSSLGMFAHKCFTGMDSFVFLCIPLFTFAGELMGKSGMMKHLVALCQLLVGRVQGGLAYVTVLASMLFGGISGSAMADISALGPVAIGMMEEAGYDKKFSAALVATSAIQGPIIPPSIPFVIFASVTNVSVGAMFLGGAVPGVMIGLFIMIVIFFMRKRKNFPKVTTKFTWQQIGSILMSAIWPMLMPIIIIGGILTGAFTATEAAAIAAAYALFVAAVVYRNMTFKEYIKTLVDATKTTASIYLIIAFSYVLGWIFAMEKVPQMIGDLVVAWHLSAPMLLFIINLFFLWCGMWISDSVQIILFAPILTPVVAAMGVNPIHFGVVVCLNVMIGLLTPPFGMAFYLTSSITKIKLSDLVKNGLPFIFSSIVVLFLITYIPDLVLFLPRLAGLVK